MSSQEEVWFILGGPFEKLLTGTIGLLLLCLFRKTDQGAKHLSCRQWTIVFVSLFWLRQTANFVVWVGSYLFSGQFSHRGDEIELTDILQFPFWTIVSLTAIICAIVLAIVLF